MEVPRYSLAERDRRWALARQITAAENVQALIAYGGPGCAGIPSTSTASKGDALHHPTATSNDWPAQRPATAVGQTGHRHVMTQQMKDHRRKDISNDRAYVRRFGR
jgi:hypothetical protein